jgi:hypothetical protein
MIHLIWFCSDHVRRHQRRGGLGIGEDFLTFCSALAVSRRSTISDRYAQITKRLNLDYWGSDSYTYHSFYTGSYGRGTAIGLTSDVDMLFRLPVDVYERFDAYQTNGQAALLQEVRSVIKKTYSVTDIGSDGSVVVVPFTDGVTFEVLPGFLNKDGSYTFPDSTSGGTWKSTNPKPEIDEIDEMDKKCNNNLKYLGRMARAWKARWEVPISGLLIDTLAYQFIRDWEYREKSFLYYDYLSRDFLDYLAGQPEAKSYWLSPGAGQYVWRTGSFEYKAKRCRNIAVEAITHYNSNEVWSARKKWRDIYGPDFPS